MNPHEAWKNGTAPQGQGGAYGGFPMGDPVAYRERTAVIFSANAVGFSVLLYLFLRVAMPNYVTRCFLFFMPGLRYFNAHLMAPEWVTQLVSGISFVLCNVAPFLLYAMVVRVPRKVALPLKKPQAAIVVPAIFIALAAAVIGSVATNALGGVMQLAGIIPIAPSFSTPTTGVGLVAGLVNLCILPALLEEGVYRGVLLQSLRRFGDGFALVISSVLFSLLHLNLLQLPVALLMGLVMGYFVLRTDSLWTGILIHFFNNLLVFLQQILFQRLTPWQADVFGTVILLVYLVLGLFATLLLSRGTESLFELRSTPSPYGMRAKARMFFSSPAILIMLVLIASILLHSVQWVPRLR